MTRKNKGKSPFRYKINPVQRYKSRGADFRTFRWSCPLHHETDFLAAENCCEKCWDDHAHILDARMRAALSHAEFYREQCFAHGEVVVPVATGLCPVCFDVRGRPRVNKGQSQRALARIAGRRDYPGHCETHGSVPFYVNTGRCSRCFNSAGGVRSQDVRSLRAIARAAGDRTYLDWCDEHGAVGHSVMQGKCLSCFTTSGMRRVGPPPIGTDRPRVRWPFSTMAVGETVVIDGARAEAARNAARAVSRNGKSFINMRLRDGPVQFWRVS